MANNLSSADVFVGLNLFIVVSVLLQDAIQE